MDSSLKNRLIEAYKFHDNEIKEIKKSLKCLSTCVDSILEYLEYPWSPPKWRNDFRCIRGYVVESTELPTDILKFIIDKYTNLPDLSYFTNTLGIKEIKRRLMKFKADPKTMFVFDDCEYDNNDLNQDIKHLFMNGKHFGISTYVSPLNVPPEVRADFD
jgi:hypothetical protein